MEHKKALLLPVLLFAACITNAQMILLKPDSLFYTANGFVFSCGVSFQHHVNPELGIMYGKNDMEIKDASTYILCYPKLATEFYMANKKPYFGPKISYEVSWWYIGARLNLIDYTNFVLQDYRFTPEVGISLRDELDIYYGYNIALGGERIANIVPNRITIVINCIASGVVDRRRRRSVY